MRIADEFPSPDGTSRPSGAGREGLPARQAAPWSIAGGYLLVVGLWAIVALWALPRLAGGDSATEALLVRLSWVAVVLAGAGALFVVARQGLARQRRIEAEKRAAEAMLEKAQKLEALGSLAGSMAHDFNNTLAVIRGMVQVVELDDFRPESMRASLQAIRLASDRAGEVVRQLMHFLQHARDEFTAEDLNAVLRDFAPIIEHAAGKEMTLHIDCAADLPPVALIRGLFEHALLNLALNARDAVRNRPQRELHLSTRTVTLRNHRSIFTHQPRSGLFAVVAVRDTGCGVSSDRLTRIFEPFYTTKDHGTGLGLASVARIMQQHGGWVEVTSQVDRGTQFDLYLPVKNAEKTTAAASLPPKPTFAPAPGPAAVDSRR